MMRPHIERAERMRVGIAVRYRVAGHEHWLDSRILDISDSGVLFGPAIASPDPGTPVEVMFSSPIPIGSMAPGHMMCAGAIIRRTGQGQGGAALSPSRSAPDARP